MRLEGKRILVTGASRGLGEALTLAFAEAGAREIVAGTRKQEDRDKLAIASARIDGKIVPVQLDVTKDDEIRAVAESGTFDVLVNNAGVAGFGNPLTMELNLVLNELEVNYVGALRMIRAVAPGMIAQRDGIIVNIGTAFAKVNLPLIGTYCATKAALLSLGQAVRAHLRDDNVRVVTVLPTTIDTDMSRGADVPKMTKEFVAQEILSAIREERHDPPIGDDAKGLLDQLSKDPIAVEKMLMTAK